MVEEGTRKRAKDMEKQQLKTVLVEIKTDEVSKELLTWALMKAVEAGDHVVALHVIRSTGEPYRDAKPSSSISLIKALDDVVAVYDGFCKLKQVDLKLKICRGPSVRRILVQEASSVLASKVVLGIPSGHELSSTSCSVAKYCAKKLCHDCSVLVLCSGKIVFQKEAIGKRSKDGIFSGCHFLKPYKKDEKTKIEAVNARSSFHCLPAVTTSRLNCEKINAYAAKLSSRLYSLKNENLEHESPSGFPSMLTPNFPQRRPGWCLLRTAFSKHENDPSQEKQKRSMFQQVMRLPRPHFSSSAFHYNGKQSKPDESIKSSNNEEVGAIISLESDGKTKDLLVELLSLQNKYSSFCNMFSYKELVHATSNFCPANLIGKGGSSRVYKGRLLDNEDVAVKKLDPCSVSMKNFVSEIGVISLLHHKNIISLRGFCMENDSLLLVYNLFSKGSLEDNLHGNKVDKVFVGWTKRLKIAIGVAEALEHLHGSGGILHLVHRDVKSSNILLSDNFDPQLSDFGLAQVVSSSMQNTISDNLEGTFGYFAPEYLLYGKVNEKIDVYAFGVVLLELLSGRKPVCNARPKGEQSLVMWAKPFLRDWKFRQLLDPSLSGEHNIEEVERMCLAALLCIRQAPGSRPSMDTVVKLLQGDDETLEWAKVERGAPEGPDGSYDEATVTDLNIQSHLNLALLGVDDDSHSTSSSRVQSFDYRSSISSLEDYLKSR